VHKRQLCACPRRNADSWEIHPHDPTPTSCSHTMSPALSVVPRGTRQMLKKISTASRFPVAGAAARRPGSKRKRAKGQRLKGTLPALPKIHRSCSEQHQHCCRGFRDTRNTKTFAAVLVRRVEVVPGRGAQGVLGVEPAATADHASLGRRAVCAIKGTFIPLKDIAALAHRSIRA